MGEKIMYTAMLNKKIVLAVSEANLVNVGRKSLNMDDYRCPHCNKKVILIISEQKAAFFKHLTNYSNAMGEKEEHHQSKMLLKAALTAAGFNAQVEIPLADGQLRADVLASEKLAFEVQCAPLSEAEFTHRHSLYSQIGVTDIWIVGRRHYLKRRLKHTQLIFFRQNKLWGNYYLEINPKKNMFCLKYNILQEQITNHLHYQIKYFALDELDIKTFWHFTPIKKRYFININSQKKYLKKQLAQKTKLGLRIGELLYQKGLTIDDLPDEVFTTWRNPGELDSITKFLQK
ncbi:competence protein [Lactobacillus helveticus]